MRSRSDDKREKDHRYVIPIGYNRRTVIVVSESYDTTTRTAHQVDIPM